MYSSPSFLDFAFLKYPLLLQILEIIEMLIFNSIDALVKLSKICFSFVPIFFEVIDLLLDLFWFSFGVRSFKVLILLFVLRLSLWSICNPFGIKPLKHSQTNRWIFHHKCKLGNNHFCNLFLVSILVWFYCWLFLLILTRHNFETGDGRSISIVVIFTVFFSGRTVSIYIKWLQIFKL